MSKLLPFRVDYVLYKRQKNLGGGGGGSGGAIVLGKLPVPGRPTNLDYSRARAYCAYSRCGWEFVWIFLLSSILSLLFLPLSGRRPDIDRNTVSKGR